VLGELMNVPTDTLIDMLYIIFSEEITISAGDAAEIEQIQREFNAGARSNAGGSKLLTERSLSVILCMSCATRSEELEKWHH
jgi:hypothetical protein